jgi:hypothetical protein
VGAPVKGSPFDGPGDGGTGDGGDGTGGGRGGSGPTVGCTVSDTVAVDVRPKRSVTVYANVSGPA